jgi:hypothetical protein
VPVEFLEERLDDATRRRRDRMIFRLRANDQSLGTIADMFDISERQVQNIVAKYRAEEREDMLDAEAARQVVRQTLDGFEESLEQVTRIAAAADQDSNRLGAVRLRLELQKARLDLLQAVGALSLQQLRAEVDVEETARLVVEELDRRGVDPEVQLAVIEAVDRARGTRALPAGESEPERDAEGTAEEVAA